MAKEPLEYYRTQSTGYTIIYWPTRIIPAVDQLPFKSTSSVTGLQWQ